MRYLIAVAVLVLPCAGFAQDDDGWDEITGMMNGMAAANQALANAGMQWTPGARGATSGSQFLDALTVYAWEYARLLNGIEDAFSPDGAAPGAYDPFDPRRPNPLMQQLQRLQVAPQDVRQLYQGQMFYEFDE